MSELSLAAKEALQQGEIPTPEQVQALERTIRLLRPAVIVENGSVPDIDYEAAHSFPEWADFRRIVSPVLRSVGRVDMMEIRSGALFSETLATCFAVSRNVVLTNSHVADQLTRGAGVLAAGQARVAFGWELGRRSDAIVGLTEVVADEPVLDLALLATDQPLDCDPIDLTIIDGPGNDPAVDTPVAAVGYPMMDTRAPEWVVGLFDGRYGVERVSPGVVMRSFTGAFMNDCSLLVGSSGSPIFSLIDGSLVGVHRGGLYLASNTAVSGSALQRFLTTHLAS